ncbi:MAG: lipoyl(octanoyl) transferase LipB [Planctomycetota bacterium]|nr:MAG: lipoyl(octanoyl) transferase LipB [Planctomycetota bacterium]
MAAWPTARRTTCRPSTSRRSSLLAGPPRRRTNPPPPSPPGLGPPAAGRARPGGDDLPPQGGGGQPAGRRGDPRGSRRRGRADRPGGDITYHGPGQLVAYPILDLNVLMLRLHDYMRLLEQSVIDTLAGFGVEGQRDPEATGVWVELARYQPAAPEGRLAKIAAMGVRVRRWVSMHGLSLNVDPDPAHFRLIVPCGLAGRPVTTLRALLGDDCPSMERVSEALVGHLHANLAVAAARAAAAHRAPT